MILDIVTEPNPILHKKSKELTKAEILNPDTQQLIHNMIETMRLKDGVGLAAPQVGKLLRIFVIEKSFTKDKRRDLVLINPVWKKAGFLKDWDDEGCLSIPNVFGKVKRFKKISIKALDTNAEPIEFVAKNFFARSIQHEADHLDGILFIEKAKKLYEIKE